MRIYTKHLKTAIITMKLKATDLIFVQHDVPTDV